jgi:hypothetical protein
MQTEQLKSRPKPLPETLADDVLWGAEAIARFIGRDEHQVCYLARRGLLPVKKVGSQLTARKSKLAETL